jgi:16S rRNA (adenine1518-N6/adenine1519-N6)-dimethyltransferase
MRAMLAGKGIRLTRARGQNFLHDRRQLERIVALAELSSGDAVLEIGAGLGPLTEILVGGVSGGRVVAVEVESRLAELLKERLAGAPNLEVLEVDALRWLRQEGRGWSGWKVVSNLPYSVASPLIVELAQAKVPPDLMVVTLQQEVAERVVAEPDCRDYGVLSLLVQLRYEPRRGFRIPASCFWPQPEVDSACVRLDRRAEVLLNSAREVHVFERLVRRAFSQRRKMIPKLLRQDWPSDGLERAMVIAGVDPKSRAEHVSLAQYVTMAVTLAGRKGAQDNQGGGGPRGSSSAQ